VSNKDGLIWAEVPMELFRQVPPKREPLTHINFFQPESLRVILERAGFAVERSDLCWHYTKGQLACRAIGRRSLPNEVEPLPSGPSFSRAVLRGDPRPLLGTVRAEPLRSAQVSLAWAKRAFSPWFPKS
jgi:hypothetical protein